MKLYDTYPGFAITALEQIHAIGDNLFRTPISNDSARILRCGGLPCPPTGSLLLEAFATPVSITFIQHGL
jgi:hypothetical protein